MYAITENRIIPRKRHKKRTHLFLMETLQMILMLSSLFTQDERYREGTPKERKVDALSKVFLKAVISVEYQTSNIVIPREENET